MIQVRLTFMVYVTHVKLAPREHTKNDWTESVAGR